MSQKHWQNIYHANVNVHENVEYLTSTIDGSMTNEIIYAIKKCYQKTCYQKMYQKWVSKCYEHFINKFSSNGLLYSSHSFI